MFTRSELVAIHLISHGCRDIGEMAEQMNITTKQVNSIIRKLRQKDVLKDSIDIEMSSNPFARRLMALMYSSAGRSNILADSGIEVLMLIRNPKTAAEIAHEAALSRSTVFRVLKVMMSAGAVSKYGRTYVINRKTWIGLEAFLNSMEDYLHTSDPRAPGGSIIYSRTKEEVIYSYDLDSSDQPTAFSLFQEYGVNGFFGTSYYTTSKRTVDLQKVFDDAFVITEATQDYRSRLMLLLFYYKHRNEIVPDERLSERLSIIESGGKMLRWPTMDDVRDRLL